MPNSPRSLSARVTKRRLRSSSVNYSRRRSSHSPSFNLAGRGKSPKNTSSSWKLSKEKRNRQGSRYRGNNAAEVKNKVRAVGGNSNGNRNNRRNWGRGSKKKKRNRGLRRGRGGGKGPPMSGGNRQPIASMRMRMDDYVPRSGRLLPASKSGGNEMEHAVVRARREASSRTKDTFWTKKLLDAETSLPNRWGHTGFKELYREELGYSDVELKKLNENSTGRNKRDEKMKFTSSKNARASLRMKDSVDANKMRHQPHPHALKEKGMGSHSKTSSSRGRQPRMPKMPRKANKRSRSFSRSVSSVTSRSDSRSYSSYSRSSSTYSTSSTSSSSSSFTSSSSASLRSYSKRSSSRSSSPLKYKKASWPSRTNRAQEAKKTSIVQTVEKRVKKSTYSSSIVTSKMKGRPGIGREASLMPHSSSGATKMSATNIPHNKGVSNEYYDPSIITEDSPPQSHPPAGRHREKVADGPESKSVGMDNSNIRRGASNLELKADSKPRRGLPATDARKRVADVVESRRSASDADSRRGARDGEARRGPSDGDPRRGPATDVDPRRGPTNPGDPRRAALDADPRRAALESDNRRPGESGHWRPGGSGDLHRSSEAQTLQIQHYKNSRLKRNAYYDKTYIHSSGVRLKRERKSNSESSSDEEESPSKLTLSERFGKLAQLSSQRQEYEGVRMKIVREGGQDKKVYLEGGSSRTPSPFGRRDDAAHERWLREHKAEYDEYQERYGEFRQWDPHLDLPRELPPNWDDINVRYQYYKESGYFGDRAISMEDYLKWEEWWYRYRDWLEKYGDIQDVESYKYRGDAASYELLCTSARWTRRDKDDRKRTRYK